ncbi:MAG: superoxide dismutase [Actinomycetota bacterium]|nr:superoxide dismutase [Actinomycetota bacterium]
MAFELPPLPYDYNALEPHIDERTMYIHHDFHHNTYVNNLNSALENYPDLQDRSIEELLSDLNSIPEDIRRSVRNNGGQHSNHSMFWEIMSPEGGGEPVGDLASSIDASFGSFDALQEQWSAVSAPGALFGSGWTWLVAAPDGSLTAETTQNGDTPLMEGRLPIIGIDLWEHAYYLKYQNARLEYVSAWWNVVNWEEAERRFQAARSS